MKCQIKIKAEGSEGWAIFIDRKPIIDFNKDGEVSRDLEVGEHSLTYDLRGAGAKLSIDIDENPPIIVPIGEDWPVEIEVPDDATGESDRIYFVIGE